MKIAKVLISSFLISGCSFGAQTNDDIRAQFLVESASDQVLREVLATPTEFFVPLSDSSVAWDRARMFFTQFLKIPSLRNAEQSIGSKGTMISNIESKNAKYLYEVDKELFGQGYNFSVTCKTKLGHGTTDITKRNAKNLARFIREGTLETTLLE